ncbi:MAG: CarD family transcriptional regulator [Chloroflexota bacterium]
MTNRKTQFARGDWLVHRNYGIGQVKRLEKKTLGDEEVLFYKVKARNSTFWVPVEEGENPRIRPVASKYKMRKAIALLKQPPLEFSKDYKERQQQIGELMSEGSVKSTAQLVRDLYWRLQTGRLNPGEQDTYDRMYSRLSREWSICMGIKVTEVKRKIKSILKK